jgi:hypothetical protein
VWSRRSSKRRSGPKGRGRGDLVNRQSQTARAEGEADEVGVALASGLMADLVKVRVHRAYADLQSAGDLRIGVAVGDQGDQFSLPGAERFRVRCRGRRPRVRGGERSERTTSR